MGQSDQLEVAWLMVRKKINYREGDWFAVPVRGGGYALGVVARADRSGGVLGYFFGPRRAEPPTLADAAGLSAADAVWVARFSYLGLVDGEWPILGTLEGWDRSAWPMPVFRRSEELTGRSLQVFYDDRLNAVREVSVPPEEIDGLPQDGLSGAGAVTIYLDRRLS